MVRKKSVRRCAASFSRLYSWCNPSRTDFDLTLKPVGSLCYGRWPERSVPFANLHLRRAHDLSGSVASVVSSNASGTNVTYAWATDNRLQTVTDNRARSVSNYAYDATNQLASMQYPNGVIHSYSYDLRNRLTNLGVHTGTSVLATYAQTFSPSGHKLSAAEANGRTPNYNYDAIYRLLNETIGGDPTAANNGALNYVLDPVGNRLSLNSTLAALPSQSFSYDGDDRVSGDTFDANGNTLTSAGVAYTYDFEDRLATTSTGVLIVWENAATDSNKRSGNSFMGASIPYTSRR